MIKSADYVCTECGEVFYDKFYREHCPLCRVKDSWKEVEEEDEGDSINWRKFTEWKPPKQGYYLVIGSVASIFGGYYGVFSAFWLSKEQKWLDVYSATSNPILPIYWADMPSIPESIREKLP